jgi:hypothetical protein
MTVAPMNAHFIWDDLSETHISNILHNIDQVPTSKGFLILVLRYCDPVTLEEYDNPKLGHTIGGMDNYYVNIIGNPVDTVEYAVWNNPTTGATRTTIYELRGKELEVKRLDVRVNTLSNSRKFVGALVSDAVMNQAFERSLDF